MFVKFIVFFYIKVILPQVLSVVSDRKLDLIDILVTLQFLKIFGSFYAMKKNKI